MVLVRRRPRPERKSMTLDLSPLKNAIARLEEGWAVYQRDTSQSLIRDGLIQRFEFTYEIAHKTLKRYLEQSAADPTRYDTMTFQDLIRRDVDIDPAQWAIIQTILQRHVPHNAVWAFGSRVTGKAKPYSDLDLAVITETPLPLRVRSALIEELSESDLPWKVDVIDWSTTSEAFQRIIKQNRVVLQEAGN
ncbi:unnamed protein product [Cyprideis torosa]|uniref:Uncharacterized protein n=1 Tax=Cyprideis torosa TaxID=163714 RepID=A0A7R8ZT59_9CRUS|nr:unnamed protein product [Cyprideis torosa]CAG0907090.1 unnamed protein product [Cyprideis torosa]